MFDELNRTLSQEEDIVPSSGFLDSVIESVRHQATAPLPIPFPWKRALPAFTLGALSLLTIVIAFVALYARLGNAPLLPASWPAILTPLLKARTPSNIAWFLAALFLTLVSVKLSTRFISGRR